MRGDVAIKVFGPDLTTLNELSGQVEAVMKKVPGNQDLHTVESDGLPYLRVVVDRLVAGRYVTARAAPSPNNSFQLFMK